ncbi:hypothetical protein [Shinella sp.]|uniref:hypothetical protein n=1 Tax=Shinella sp. TaxID=1870904 RepID=UPI00258CD5D1|nr:hypothetical protein [Shinella sp.]MCW5711261.1 hypothetical protein [Shinella sp.]
MTILTWPSQLPRPERDTWNLTRQDARRKLRSDTGPPRYRRRMSAVAKLVSLSMMVSRDGKAIFDRFYDHETENGTLLFRMPDPTTDGWALLTENDVPILANDNQYLLLSETWLCAWGDQPPSETVVGVEFRISFSVVVMP